MEDRFYQPLLESIVSLPVIDCHEHTYLPEQRPMPVDLWTLFRNSDVGDDLISAGMPSADRPLMDWRRVSAYLPTVYNTGFYRSLVAAFQELFDFDGDQLTAENWPALSQSIQDANDRPDWYAEVLQRRGNIKLVLRVQGDEADPFSIDRRLFAPLILVDDWVLAAGAERRERLAEQAGGTAGTLSEYLNALEAAIQQAKERHAAGLKSMLAYRRTIAHDCPERDEIEVLYGKLHRSGHEDLIPAEKRAFEDFMIHAVARLAGEYDLPIQVHVGYGSWQSNITAQANPILLNPLIEAHRQTKFVLLHGGYPFIGEMATLAKNHPNVFIEAGWLAYIAPAAYRRAMGEWLDSVPCNKILAFSADCLHIEQTYGALLLTRQLLAQCLAEKIESAGWDMGFCHVVARRLLSDNASALYRLKRITEHDGWDRLERR